MVPLLVGATFSFVSTRSVVCLGSLAIVLRRWGYPCVLM